MTTYATTKRAYDYYIVSAYYADRDEMVACIGTLKGCTIRARELVNEGAVYCHVKGCIETDAGTLEFVRKTITA